MLGALSFHLTVYHPFRPLKALLRACIEQYAKAAEGDSIARTALTAVASAASAEGASPPTPALLTVDDPLFRSQWDMLQVLHVAIFVGAF